MTRRPTSARVGFTLLEMLAASVLTALLMAAVLLSLRGSLLTASEVARSRQTASPELLREQLRRDLGNALTGSLGTGRITLWGPIATDARTRQPTLRPALVFYAVAGGRLVREEQSPRSRQRDVAWDGVGRFTVLATREAVEPGPPDVRGLRPLPPAMAVQLLDPQGQIILTERLHAAAGGGG